MIDVHSAREIWVPDQGSAHPTRRSSGRDYRPFNGLARGGRNITFAVCQPGRVVLHNRETVLTETAPQEFAENNGSSMSTGLVNPKRPMLSAICRICFFECVRALFGYGLSWQFAVRAKKIPVRLRRELVRISTGIPLPPDGVLRKRAARLG